VWECELKDADALRRRLFSAIMDKPSMYDAGDKPLLLAAEKQAAYGPAPKGKGKTKSLPRKLS
jgi:hypothetical protein